MPSLSEYVFAGAERLTHGPHPDRALRDAEFLMMYVLGKGRAWMLSRWHDQIDTHCSIPYHSAIERRRRGEPVQYITGEAEFYGLPFRVTHEVLIPRPETEHAVEKVLELAARFQASRIPPNRIVDVGTGSGAIAVALARHLPDAAITATDLSPAALEVAGGNAARNGMEGGFVSSRAICWRPSPLSTSTSSFRIRRTWPKATAYLWLWRCANSSRRMRCLRVMTDWRSTAD